MPHPTQQMLATPENVSVSRMNITEPGEVGLGLFSILVIFTCTRGLLEMFFGKGVAAALQAGIVFFSFFLWWRRGRNSPSEAGRFTKRAAFAFILLASISTVISIPGSDVRGVLATFAAMALFAFCLLGGAGTSVRLANGRRAIVLLGLVGLALAFSGIAQQLGLETHLSGNTLWDGALRPASLTGSYLHYPLCLSIICLQVLQGAIIYKGTWMRVCFVFLLLALLASYGRSGYAIVGMALVLVGLSEFFRRAPVSSNRQARRAALVVTALILIVAVGFIPDARQRVESTFNLQEPSNSGRLDAWSMGAILAARCGILVSSCTGTVGNTAATFTDSLPVVVESGFLQQIINFGLLATIAFYLLLFGLYRACHPNHKVLRALILASVAESLVYQSIEVIPFIVLIAITPILSRTLSAGICAEPLTLEAEGQIAG